jgi:hypothetical protein
VHEHSHADRVPPALHKPSRLPGGPELRGSRQHDAKELPTHTETNTVNKKLKTHDAVTDQRDFARSDLV